MIVCKNARCGKLQKKYLSNIYKQRTCWAEEAGSGTAGYVSARNSASAVAIGFESHIENENFTLINQTCRVATRGRACVRFV